MPATDFVNRVFVSTSTTGTGTLTLGAAVASNMLTPSEAGATDGETYSYVLEEGGNVEIGNGVLGAGGTTLTRATVAVSKISGSAGTSKINLTGSGRVRFAETAEDMLKLIAGISYTGLVDKPDIRKTLTSATQMYFHDGGSPDNDGLSPSSPISTPAKLVEALRKIDYNNQTMLVRCNGDFDYFDMIGAPIGLVSPDHLVFAGVSDANFGAGSYVPGSPSDFRIRPAPGVYPVVSTTVCVKIRGGFRCSFYNATVGNGFGGFQVDGIGGTSPFLTFGSIEFGNMNRGSGGDANSLESFAVGGLNGGGWRRLGQNWIKGDMDTVWSGQHTGYFMADNTEDIFDGTANAGNRLSIRAHNYFRGCLLRHVNVGANPHDDTVIGATVFSGANYGYGIHNMLPAWIDQGAMIGYSAATPSTFLGSGGLVERAGGRLWAGTDEAPRVIRYTRDMAAASGAVAFTGFGFRPRSVHIYAADSSLGGRASIGMAADGIGASLRTIHVDTAGAFALNNPANQQVINVGSTASSQSATLMSFDPDGITLNFTKTDNPTGTMLISIWASPSN